MGDSNDPSDEPTQPERREPFETATNLGSFYRELVEVQLDCDELLTALEQGDPLGVEIAACDLGATWVLVITIVKLIDLHCTEAHVEKHRVQLAFRACHHVLAHLFKHAFAETARWTTDVPRLHGILERVAARLRLGIPHHD